MYAVSSSFIIFHGDGISLPKSSNFVSGKKREFWDNVEGVKGEEVDTFCSAGSALQFHLIYISDSFDFVVIHCYL